MTIQLKEGLTFNEVYSALGISYKTVDIRALCVSIDGNWVNYGAVLFPTMKEEQEVKSAQDSDMSVLQKYGVNKIRNELRIPTCVMKGEALPSLFELMQTGMLLVADASIVSSSLRGGYEKTGQARYEEYGIPFGEYTEYPSFSLYVSSNQPPLTEFGKLNLRSKLLTLGIGEEVLVEKWLKIKNQFPSFNCIIAFPIYVKIEGLKYLGGRRFNLQMRVHKSLRTGFSALAVLRRYLMGIGHITLGVFKEELASLSAREEGDFAYINHDIEFDAIPAQDDWISIKVVNETLGIVVQSEQRIQDVYSQRTYADSFLHVATGFIPLDELENRLLNAQSKAGGGVKAQALFEQTVAWLLCLLGFRTLEPRELAVLRSDSYEVGDADIIVQDTDSKKILAVSCSLKPPRPDKIDRIANLVGYIREHYAMVDPLMLISEDAGEVKSNNRQVKVLDKGDIKQIVGLLRAERVGEARAIVVRFEPMPT